MTSTRVVGDFIHHVTVCDGAVHVQFPRLAVTEDGILENTPIEYVVACNCERRADAILVSDSVLRQARMRLGLKKGIL
ncbi:MAG: hypothetical protein HYS74_02810 [Parcubacteria group bacterium]|nr:hypothetical protein [Parcubacteria group bacterium]